MRRADFCTRSFFANQRGEDGTRTEEIRAERRKRSGLEDYEEKLKRDLPERADASDWFDDDDDAAGEPKPK